ncbi:MAG TPA: hypothetical protein DCL41_07770 [Bdellovibrionales bacterium]|nr:hypothetical protein [Pseudobdellovibrionaceae bacterium]HAG91753.1 hypothetical protein [Bdellovibrionales bacterium]
MRILGVQVDLLARSPRGVKTLFEVKSARSLDFGVLSEAQKCRLVRVAEWLSAREPCFLRVLVEKADKDGFLEIPIED